MNYFRSIPIKLKQCLVLMLEGATALHHGIHSDSGVTTATAPARSTLCSKISAQLIPKNTREDFMATEGRVLALLNGKPHPSIARIEACVDSASSPAHDGAVIFPAFHDDLHTFVRESGAGLTETTARSLFRQMAAAVAHCHAHRIVLGDIKLGKFLFRDRLHEAVFVSDFSCAALHPAGERIVVQKGSPAYVAPETMQRQPCDPMAAEVWSMGVCLYVTLTCAYPFFAKDPATLYHKIVRAEVAYPSWISPAAKALLARMLARSPAARPTMEEVLQDRWLQAKGPSDGCDAMPPPLVHCGQAARGVKRRAPSMDEHDQQVPK